MLVQVPLQDPVKLRVVNGQLFPYLHGFAEKAAHANTIEYKIGEIFGEIKNRIRSGAPLPAVMCMGRCMEIS